MQAGVPRLWRPKVCLQVSPRSRCAPYLVSRVYPRRYFVPRSPALTVSLLRPDLLAPCPPARACTSALGVHPRRLGAARPQWPTYQCPEPRGAPAGLRFLQRWLRHLLRWPELQERPSADRHQERCLTSPAPPLPSLRQLPLAQTQTQYLQAFQRHPPHPSRQPLRVTTQQRSARSRAGWRRMPWPHPSH